jgi:thymidylate synthase
MIVERTIEDAWRMVMWHCARFGDKYTVKKGSYEGQLRKQLDNITVCVTHPFTRPLAVTLPEHLGIPAPTNEERINQYFYDYLITDTKTDKEDYTYGQYISKQIDRCIEILNISEGGTNQACITIGDAYSIDLDDPPCLRVVDFKVVLGRLTMTVFFRSWDLFAGFPENIGGLQLLKEYVLMNLTFPVEDGMIFAYSSGAHIYEQYFPLADQLCAHKC